MTADPADRISGSAPVIALNPYQYGRHNPARFFDPTGAFEVDTNAFDAFQVAAQRIRQSVRPVERRPEGAITFYLEGMGWRFREQLWDLAQDTLHHPENIIGPGELQGMARSAFRGGVKSSLRPQPPLQPSEGELAPATRRTQLKDPKTGRFITDLANPPSPYDYNDAQRRADWKRLYNDPDSPLTEAQRKQIKARGWRGPQRLNPETDEIETMELSHEPKRLREGGTEVVLVGRPTTRVSIPIVNSRRSVRL